MAKIFVNGKWKKRTLTALSATLALSLSLGILSACNDSTDEDEEDNTVAAQTDTQLIKNGNFEFYGDKPLEFSKRKNFINSPDSWTNSRGSDSLGTAPSSDTKSGIVDTAEWETLSVSKLGENKFSSVADAMARWEDGSIYDRLKFYDEFEDELDDLDKNSEESKFFAKYSYSIDFEDVEKLKEEVGTLSTRYTDTDEDKDDNTNVLMIHNQKKTDSVWGTAQYYTSGTTVTLEAGTSAKVSVWVKTASLKHWYEGVEATSLGGAYIGVTHTVGGTTLDQMQIKNINTKNVEDNNGWEEYTLYVRASTFATSTFRIVLGLGFGSTGNMDETVDGYAFFDDLTCDVISNAEYIDATGSLDAEYKCGADTRDADKKKFNAAKQDGRTYALDLYAEGSTELAIASGNVEIGLTKETSGSVTYDPTHADESLTDDQTKNYSKLATLAELSAAANGNYVLKKILDDDFKTDAYPLNRGGNVIMLMSANGTAYTAKLSYNGDTNKAFTLAPDENMLVSFFVKTSEIASGLTGAGATLVDGDNRTSISPFDSTAIKTVDIDDENKDINNGWVQCFFFVSNDTDEEKTFRLEFTYGPTTITGTNKHSYGDGYAAFTGFETRMLTKHEYSYASTGDRAQKVALSGGSSVSNSFDTVAATGKNDLEKTLALPANYQGILGGGKFVTGEGDDAKPANVYSGLLNKDYAAAYTDAQNGNGAWTGILSSDTGADWWKSAFGDAVQPLVIVNGAATEGNTVPAYGYYASSATVSASSYTRLSMRVKASVGAKAYIYLTDTSDIKKGYDNRLVPNMPLVTYWYDDEGNICASDPQDKDYDEKTGVLYTLGENGLYTDAKNTSDKTYYANLYNYDKDDNGNLITSDNTVAFYAHDGKFYAYYDEDTDVYSTEVKNLPKTAGENKITRYDFTEETMPEAYMVVDGTGDWIDVSFLVHAGNADKNYRLEVWSGSRDGSVKNPENTYVIFDNYASADISSNYATLLDESVQAMKKAQDKGEDENLEENALYYTFTFFDSTSYLRYDKTEDKDELGNPWENYAQSTYEEQIVYLYHKDVSGELTGAPAYTMYLDYGATDVTVERAAQDSGDDGNEDNDNGGTGGDVNVWLIVSSASLAVVLLVAIVLVIVRRFLKKHPRVKRVKAAKPKKKKAEKAPLPEEPAKEEKPDEDKDNPYNE